MFDENRARFLINSLKPARLTRVVDIGANPLSPAPYTSLLKMGGCDMWGFEPQQDAYAKLLNDAGPRENYFPCAVGAGGINKLYICKGSGFTSTLEPNQQAVDFLGQFSARIKIIDVINIETNRLDDIQDLPPFDLLKIDIQGGECSVYEYGSQKLSQALAVISEVAAIPLYIDQPLLDAQMISLRKIGFDLHKFLFFKSLSCRNKWTTHLNAAKYKNQLVDGDAVFVRNLLKLNRFDSESLKHLVILADAVFNSIDLAVIAMGYLVDRGNISKNIIDQYIEQLK